MNSVLSKIKKRIDINKEALTKNIKNDLTVPAAKTKLVKFVAWKIFGFPESQIISIDDNKINLTCDDEIQYSIEISNSSLKDVQKVSKNASDHAYRQKLRHFVLTDGLTWAIYEANIEKAGEYSLLSSFDLAEIDLESQKSLESIENFCAEIRNLVPATDTFNSKRWYGYKKFNSNDDTNNVMVLVDFTLYENSSERVHIPLLKLTYWSDVPFEARQRAWKSIDKYISANISKVELDKFESTAYKMETKELINKF